MKSYRNFLRYTIFWITYVMHSHPIFLCIMTMTTNFTIFFIFHMFIFNFSFLYDSCCSFVNNFSFFFLKLIISIACSVKDSQNFFMESLPLYTSWLFSMLLNDDIVDIQNPDDTCSVTFVVREFSGLFFHPSVFSIKLSRSA